MIRSAIITGHTKGIGLATLGLLEKNGVKTMGLSRTNGFDLKKNYQKVRDFVIESDFDVFINNAYVPEKQTMLLRDVYNSWTKKDKLIINICSVASLLPATHSDYGMQYPREKREQRDFCNRINFDYSKKDFKKVRCSIVNLNFDYVNTSFRSKYDKKLFPSLEPEEVAEIVWYTICSFGNNICFRDVSFHSTRKPQTIN